LFPLASEFLLSLLSFVVDNRKRFTFWHTQYKSRHKHYLNIPNANLTSYQKGAYYAGIKLFNALPSNIKSLNHYINEFKPALKDYRLLHSFYSVEFTSIENS
jgi:hypothetical protein